MISESQKSQIQKEAKQILDNFASSLEKVKLKEKPLKLPIGGFREEGTGEQPNEEFRREMFANAPSKEGDFIIAEKKKW